MTRAIPFFRRWRKQQPSPEAPPTMTHQTPSAFQPPPLAAVPDARPGDAHLRQLLGENSQDMRAVLREILEATADLRGELRRHRRTVYRRWLFRFLFGLIIGVGLGYRLAALVTN